MWVVAAGWMLLSSTGTMPNYTARLACTVSTLMTRLKTKTTRVLVQRSTHQFEKSMTNLGFDL